MLFKVFNLCVHILYSYSNVCLYMYITLPNTARIVFENNGIWESPSLKVLNASYINYNFIVLYHIVSKSIHGKR